MSLEAELPGRLVTPEELQIIYTRYYHTLGYITNKEILEVACGPGLGLGLLSSNAKKVIAWDYSKVNVEIAKAHYKYTIDISELDAHNLPFKNESFDVIIALEVLLYLDIPKFLAECDRVLKRDGILIVDIPNKDRPNFKPSNLSRNYFSVNELQKFFVNQKFDTSVYGLFRVNNNINTKRSVVKKSFIKVIGTILKILPKGKDLKQSLSKKVFKKVELPPELTLNITTPEKLIKIDASIPNNEYKVIYIVAKKYVG